MENPSRPTAKETSFMHMWWLWIPYFKIDSRKRSTGDAMEEILPSTRIVLLLLWTLFMFFLNINCNCIHLDWCNFMLTQINKLISVFSNLGIMVITLLSLSINYLMVMTVRSLFRSDSFQTRTFEARSRGHQLQLGRSY